MSAVPFQMQFSLGFHLINTMGKIVGQTVRIIESVLLKRVEVPLSKSSFLFCELFGCPYYITRESSGNLLLRTLVTHSQERECLIKRASKMQKKNEFEKLDFRPFQNYWLKNV